MLRKTPEEIVVGKKGDEWILVRKTLSEGVRLLLQQRRDDASKPYYLTQRIFMSRQRATTVMERVIRTGVLRE